MRCTLLRAGPESAPDSFDRAYGEKAGLLLFIAARTPQISARPWAAVSGVHRRIGQRRYRAGAAVDAKPRPALDGGGAQALQSEKKRGKRCFDEMVGGAGAAQGKPLKKAQKKLIEW